jgi:hypothetical protein
VNASIKEDDIKPTMDKSVMLALIAKPTMDKTGLAVRRETIMSALPM